ncbi:MAG TPA: radical SAM protein [Planctomycetes bacterium]|nr:radical SAM protein [Planctomycetota bacterium]
MSKDGHSSTDTVLYGPVSSRRYGVTLGVNPMPRTEKLCNYNCVYCQLGWTPTQQTGWTSDQDLFVQEGELREAFAAADPSSLRGVDALMICGNGEPTLHPRFEAFVDALIAERDARMPGCPVICLTNGTRLTKEEVRRGLSRLDSVAVKLDAGAYEDLRRVNMPRSRVDLLEMGRAVKSLPHPVVQTCFVDGAVSNHGERALSAWFEALKFIHPTKVEIYSVSRPPPSQKIRAVSRQRLEEIARRVREELSLAAEAY